MDCLTCVVGFDADYFVNFMVFVVVLCCVGFVFAGCVLIVL